MTEPIADYEEHRGACEALLRPECGRRILLLRGLAGTGKSLLLERYLETIPSEICLVSIDLKGGATALTEIFSLFGIAVSQPLLPRLSARIAALEGGGTGTVVVDNNRQWGSNNTMNVVLHTGDATSQMQRRTELTNALFKDLAELGRLVLVLFDTFEHAPSEVKDWLTGPFLARTVHTPGVQVVIAGQEVPSKTIAWGHCFDLRNLVGVKEARHWVPVVQQMRKRVPSPPQETQTYLKGICDALQGNPLAIMSFIEGLESEEFIV